MRTAFAHDDDTRTATNIPAFDVASGMSQFRPIPTANNDDEREINCNGSFNNSSLIFGDEGRQDREVSLPDLVPPPPLGERTRHIEHTRHIEAANDRDDGDVPQQRQRAFKPGGLGL